MDALIIDSTPKSPAVILDPNSLKFEISGESRPENANKFYEPILMWLEQFQADAPSKFSFVFKFNYFNSTSAKFVVDILNKLENYTQSGKTVLVEWHYDGRDEDMKESGEELSQLVNLPFEFIEE